MRNHNTYYDSSSIHYEFFSWKMRSEQKKKIYKLFLNLAGYEASYNDTNDSARRYKITISQ